MTRPIRAASGLLWLASAAAAQEYVISTFAGGGAPTTPSKAVEAPIGTPSGVATDAAGNVYFASRDLNSVFKLRQDGALTRVAGNASSSLVLITDRTGYAGDGGPATSAQLRYPSGLAVDSAGNLFIADTGNNRIRKVFPNGLIVTAAGGGDAGFSGDGGPATGARLNGPVGVAVDDAGNLFIADRGNYRIRKVSRNGIIATVAGTGACCFSGDGEPAISAAVVAVAVAMDTAGNLFIADSIHVRKVSPGGIITTVAGEGTHPAIGGGGPWSMAVDGAGSLFIANLCSIRKITASGIITTVAGTCMAPGSYGDGGPATNAQLSAALGVAVDGAGNLFIADAGNYRIRQVSPSGTITTIAGNGVRSSSSASGDDGPATSVQLRYPSSVAADAAGNVFIADTNNNRIRHVFPSGIITTVAGTGTSGFSGDGSLAINAQLRGPTALALDGAGDLFFADSNGTRIRKVSVGGIITTVAGNGLQSFNLVDGVAATSAALSGYIGGLAVDKAGNLFIADTGSERIRKVSPDGIINTVVGGGTDFGDGGPAAKAQILPWGVIVDSHGNLLIADQVYGRVRKVTPDGTITTVAGVAGYEDYSSSRDGGPATSARLSAPAGLALDREGNLFIADPGSDFITGGETGLQACCDYRIRKISPDGIIRTVAGIGTPGFSGDGGPASTAVLNGPLGVAVDGAGNVYVADSYNGVVRVLRPTGRSLLIGAVVDAADPRAGSVSPGKIVVIYGARLGPGQLVENRASNGALGTELSGTTVSFTGIAAPILYTSPTQVAAVVPYSIAGTTAKVAVTYQGEASNEFTVIITAASPSLFTVNQEGWGQAAAINAADGTVNTALNPAKIGGFISVYVTGEGQTAPAGVDGRITGPAPAGPVLPVSVMVGGIPALIQYAGGAPGQVTGLMQVNAQIPGGVPPGGYIPIVLQVGDASTTPAAVWIAISGG